MSLRHQIALTLIKGVGSLLAQKLIKVFGDAEAVFSAKRRQLLAVEGIGSKTANDILYTNALEKASEQLDFVEKHKIKVLFYGAETYPQKLKNCYDAPLLLYYKGNADIMAPRIVSIVGTRNATPYGKMLCAQLIENLKSYGVLVVSGLAYGIDAIIHLECVNNHVPTIGVLGHGLDRIYPSVNKELAIKMLKNGGLLTEFLPGTSPNRENFPKRNRIIAGIADATIVIEASIKGGALITAELANSYNKDVFAFPGRINDEYSEGCNFLIKTNRAALINNVQDLIYYLGWDQVSDEKKELAQINVPLNLSKDEQAVFKALQNGALAIDDLADNLEMPQSKLTMILLTLELQGLIVALPGKFFKLS